MHLQLFQLKTSYCFLLLMLLFQFISEDISKMKVCLKATFTFLLKHVPLLLVKGKSVK